MRTIIAIIVLSSLFYGAFGAPIPQRQPRHPQEPIRLDQNAVLYITIMQNLFDDKYGNSFNDSDRFHYMETEIEKAMKITDFPMRFKVERFSANRVPAGNPELLIHLNRWGGSLMEPGGIEVSISATIKEDAGYREKKRVGKIVGKRGRISNTYTQRDSVFGQTPQRAMDTYNELFRKAIIDVLRELNKSFEVTLEGKEIEKEAED